MGLKTLMVILWILLTSIVALGTMYTEDKLEYTFFPVKKESVTFSVKADHDAHVALSSKAGDSQPLVEIFLGGWDNSKSAIRFNKEKPDRAEVSTPSMLSADEERTFVVSWTSNGKITAWMSGASEPLLIWKTDTPFPIKFFGVRTAWGSTGNWKIDGLKEVQTGDSMEYKWFPVHGAQLDFEVKAKNDAQLAFASGPSDDTPLCEIFLGGWGNSKSALRLNKEKPDVAEAAVEGAVNGDKFKKFWVKLSYGSVQVDRDGEAEPFLSWTNPEPILITHFGIRTSWGAAGHWRIDDVKEDKFAPTESLFEFIRIFALCLVCAYVGKAIITSILRKFVVLLLTTTNLSFLWLQVYQDSDQTIQILLKNTTALKLDLDRKTKELEDLNKEFQNLTKMREYENAEAIKPGLSCSNRPHKPTKVSKQTPETATPTSSRPIEKITGEVKTAF